MEILEVVKKIPPRKHDTHAAKYEDIYEMVDKLRKGDWLPIKFDSSKEANKFRSSANARVIAKQRLNIVYLTKREYL